MAVREELRRFGAAFEEGDPLQVVRLAVCCLSGRGFLQTSLLDVVVVGIGHRSKGAGGGCM
jgi:hypothetical protein